MSPRPLKALAIIIFLLIFIVFGLYFYAVSTIRSEIVSLMKQELKALPDPEVVISTSIIHLPMGKIPQLNISAKSVNFDGLLAKDLNIEINDIDVNMIDSLSGELVFGAIGVVDIDIIIDESAINNSLPSIVDVSIQKDEIMVSINILGREEKLNGDIIVEDDEIRFVSKFGDISRIEQLNDGPLSIENSFDVMNDKIIKIRKVEEHQGFLKVFASSE